MASKTNTLKLGGGKICQALYYTCSNDYSYFLKCFLTLEIPPQQSAEPILPGLALPEAFESLDKRIESTVQFCRLKGSVESQILGLVAVCQEMQRLLKFAFIGESPSQALYPGSLRC